MMMIMIIMKLFLEFFLRIVLFWLFKEDSKEHDVTPFIYLCSLVGAMVPSTM